MEPFLFIYFNIYLVQAIIRVDQYSLFVRSYVSMDIYACNKDLGILL